MTRLFLNNTEIDVPDSLSIQLVRESASLTDSSEWTFDFELSMLSKRNRQFFGQINRADVEKNIVYYDCRLTVSNKTIMVGIAVVMQVTNTSINIQLLGGNASVNYKNNIQDLYIDKIDLGTVFDETYFYDEWEDCDIDGSNLSKGWVNVNDIHSLKYWLAIENEFDYQNITKVRSGFDQNGKETGWYLMPAITENGETVNALYLHLKHMNIREVSWEACPMAHILGYGFCFAHDQKTGEMLGGRKGYVQQTRNKIIAPQPTLWLIVERLVKALGFSIKREDISFYNDNRKYIYIPNVTETMYLKDMLPHWKVNEFLTELESTLGVKFVFDEISKSAKIINKNIWYENSRTIYLKEVEDDYSFEMDKENQTNITGSNVSFQISGYNKHCFPESMEDVYYEDFNSLTEIQTYMVPGSITPKGHNSEKTVACFGGRQYALYENKLIEVNELRDYKIIDSNSNISLKIKAAKMGLANIQVYESSQRNGFYPIDTNHYYFFGGNPGSPTIPTPIAEPYGEYDADKFSIEEYIDGAEPINKPDYIPIAIYTDKYMEEMIPTNTYKSFGVSNRFYPVDTALIVMRRFGLSFGKDDSDIDMGEPSILLRLNKVKDKETLWNFAINVGTKIETTKKYTFKFYDKTNIDFEEFVNIKGKRYVCAKIEEQIDKEGIKKLKKGEFYPAN